MSYPSHSSTSSGIASGHSGRRIVQPQAIQSAISTYQHKSSQIGMVARGDEIYELDMQLEAAITAYSSREIGKAEFDAIVYHINDAIRDRERRYADYCVREQAGQTRPVDWYKEFYGYTEEQAEEHLREELRLRDIRNANQARGQSRMLQQSRHGRGH
ncbi:hypothetical protein EWM64_g374 [Hericium alpestre]|uniref:Uncharacterized protein n=1 Tax=Hericium alpestre TaxID=135208 RepID=A0A4Z0ACW6_9AGAM|nr:hypothetical protein EWM64_g374 [Hericium alpestre]